MTNHTPLKPEEMADYLRTVSFTMNGAGRIHLREAAAEIERLRAQPRYFSGCLRDGVCRGVCEFVECPNHGMVVAARLVVEKQVEGIVYPDLDSTT